MYNNGFLIHNDRFHLLSAETYILTGWLVPDAEVSVYLDKTKLASHTQILSDIISEKEHGRQTRVLVTIPEHLAKSHALRAYVSCDGKKTTCFYITVKELLKKRGAIQTFFDEVYVSHKDNVCRIHGWCASALPVSIAVAGENKEKINCTIQRFNRKDVVHLYGECDVDPHCGFMIEMNAVPKGRIYLLLKTKEKNAVEEIDLSPTSLKLQRLVRLYRKGRNHLYYNGLGSFLKKAAGRVTNGPQKPVVYQEWIQKHLRSASELSRQRAHVFAHQPLISIVVPLYKTPEQYLREFVESVQAQTYENWQLCLSDGSGPDSPLTGQLQKLTAADRRIQVVYHEEQLHIAENTNEAIRIAAGEYIAFSDHDDLLTPDALYECVKAINEDPQVEVLYSDEDKVTVTGEFMQPHMKPDFNQDLLCTVNYICHLLVVKQTMIEQVGMLRPEFDGAQDYDFILRCTEAANHIHHIPRILYHWRFFEGSTAENPESKLYAFEAGKRAIEAHYERLGVPVKIENGEYLGLYRTTFIRSNDPLVSIIIPNKDHIEDLQRCIASIESKATYRNIEYIIVENNSVLESTFDYYKTLEEQNAKVRVVRWAEEFNYSAINNYGVSFAKGEYLWLLNNDTEIINEDCIEELLGYCMRKDVGAVGGRLYFDDDTIQHAGVIVGFGGIAGHAFLQQKRGFTGYCHRIITAQNYSAVTAACMMVPREVYEAVGGFSEELKVAFNDIDFCMKIRALGKLIVYNPYVEMYHYESKSRGLEDTPEKVARFQGEIETFKRKWPEILLKGDPYYNPNLTLDSQDFSLRRI
ncbi:MAG: glycosyltransferase family 2 protein [Lachnospiraceae bacterium]